MAEPLTVGACVVLALSFLVGAPGNLLVIWTILRHVKRRSHIVLLILHLAAADLLVLVTVPLWIYAFACSWVFGEAACKALTYIITSCMYSSVFLITLMSVERFVAICFPIASLRWKNKGKVLSRVPLALWAAAFLFGIPGLLTRRLGGKNGEEQCLYRMYLSASQMVAFLLLELLAGFVVPFAILAVCYGCLFSRIRKTTFKSKQKSTGLIAAVVAVFLLCWLPHQVENVLSLIIVNIQESNPYMAHSVATVRHTMTVIAGALVFISSSLNPLLYVFAARNFKSSLRATGIQRLFQHLSHPGAGNGAKELSASGKQQSSKNMSTMGSVDTKVPTDVTLNSCVDMSS